MTKRWLLASLVFMLAFALVGSSVLAKATWDRTAETKTKVKTYNIPQEDRVTASRHERPSEEVAVPVGRVSLGATALAGDEDIPYNIVDMSYNDFLYYSLAGYQVVQDETANNKIHFAYQNLDDPTDNRQMGYQVYDPSAGTGSTFPQGTDGCIVQPGTDYGRNPKIDVFPTGRPILAGYDSASGDIDFHAYWDLTGNCLWGAGSQFDPNDYNNLAGMTTNDNQLLAPIIRVQDVGGTLYTHVVTTGSGVENFWGESSESCPVVYYRSSGNPPSGTWTDGVVIDTTVWFYTFGMACSKVSDNVVVTYVKPTDEARAELNGGSDCDVWFCESTDGGATWGTRTNVTQYDRTADSYAAWAEATPFYDTEDNLHIIWNAHPIPANVYTETTGYAWGTTWSCYLFHWRRLAAGGDTNTAIFHDADWADGGQPTCGFGGSGAMTASFLTMGECAGRLYVVFGMANDMSVEPQLLDDCMSDQTSGVYSGMYELYMVVSSDLTGDAWDSYRNITHTYSPSVFDENNTGCDSATGNGICYSEYKPSLFYEGFDVTDHPYNDIDSVLTAFYDPAEWSDPAQVPMQGTWTNDSALHLMYMNDHWGGRVAGGQGEFTLNEVAWIRLGCVDPIVAAKISADQRAFAWPDFVHNGDEDTMTISLFNSGNTDLIIDSIVAYEETGSVSGWLGLSGTTLPNIPIQSNSTFDIYLNENGIIDNGVGGSEEALGTVVIYSNAANNDSLVIDIQMYVADEVQGMAYDTIATADLFAKASGDDIALIVDNVGSMANNGNASGGATMDFMDSQECDTTNATVYMYSGGPILLHNPGDTVLISSSLHADGLSRENSFVPLVAGVGGGLQGGATATYDSVYTGEFANWDTSCVMTRTLYAPLNSASDPAFIVACTKLYQPDGAAGTIDNLTIGTAIDWDVPGMAGSDDSSTADNTSGIATSGKYVYVVGTDSAGYDGSACQSNTGRFAGDAFIGSYFTSDASAGTNAPHGVFSDRFHDWWDESLDTAVAQIWDTLAAYTGLTATDSRNDLAVFQTARFDFSLPAGDTLVFWSVMATQRDGDAASFDATMEAGLEWATTVVCPQCIFGCCIGQRGDIDLEPNCTPEEQVADIGDLTNLINHLFISFDPICCPEEADIAPIDTPNPGDVGDGVVDIGDLTSYINYLFITFVAPGAC